MSSAPSYRPASCAGDTLTLETGHLRLDVFKRLTGWAWCEIYTPLGKLIGIHKHLGEIMIRDQEIPMRLESSEQPEYERGPKGKSLAFHVRSRVAREKLAGTSFEPWINDPHEGNWLPHNLP